MDQGLFAKHIRSIEERNSSKEQILRKILEDTGVSLKESEITIQKKKVRITTSSVKRSLLTQKGVDQTLSSLGYDLTR